MATVTLSANTDYSALTLASDDTIDCAGFVLTIDIQPVETDIQVTSTAIQGSVVFSGGWYLPTWDFHAGPSTSNAGMISTLPEGAVIRNVVGGPSNNGRGVATNNGYIASATGGSGSNAPGVNANSRFGTIGTVTGSSSGSSFGVNNNAGLILEAVGGGSLNAQGVNTNSGTVVLARGGTVSGTVGITTNNGICLRILDGTEPAVLTWNGKSCFVEGPYVNGVIPDNIKTIYSLGTLSGGATIAGDATVIELGLAGGGTPGPARPRQGNLIGRSF